MKILSDCHCLGLALPLDLRSVPQDNYGGK
jgi:hypothetical protein